MSIIVLLLYICDLDLVKLHVAFLFLSATIHGE